MSYYFKYPDLTGMGNTQVTQETKRTQHWLPGGLVKMTRVVSALMVGWVYWYLSSFPFGEWEEKIATKTAGEKWKRGSGKMKGSPPLSLSPVPHLRTRVISADEHLCYPAHPARLQLAPASPP